MIEVDDFLKGKTIKFLLFSVLKYSNSMVKKLKFSKNGILVNGHEVTVRYVMSKNDLVTLDYSDNVDEVSPYIVPSDAILDVLYEDGDVLVVNKPPFMPVHPSFGHRSDTLANAIANRYTDEPYVFRPVNRIDRDTSGIVLVANNKLSSCKLNQEMIEGKINKTYLAVVDGVPEKKSGSLVSYIRRKPGSIMLREECGENENGKFSKTDYYLLYTNGKYSVLLVHPITGRTHQIRVHFSGIRCPIVGDDLYGEHSDYINRQALHALSLEFLHPVTDKKMKLYAHVPDDIQFLLDNVFDIGANTIIDMVNCI